MSVKGQCQEGEGSKKVVSYAGKEEAAQRWQRLGARHSTRLKAGGRATARRDRQRKQKR